MTFSIDNPRGVATTPLRKIFLGKNSHDNNYYYCKLETSLLNVDYKFITEALTNRTKKVLVDIIHSDQTGFFKRRYIREKVRILLDVTIYADNGYVPGFAFAIDFEKAFEKLQWNCINKALEHFGFSFYVVM